MNHSKRLKNKMCCLCGTTGVNGSHIFSAGKYPELANYPWNVLPMCPNCHTDGKNAFEGLSTPDRLIRLAKHYSREAAWGIYSFGRLLWLKQREDFTPFENTVDEI